MAGDVRDEGRRMGLGLQCAASYQRHAHSEKGGRRRKKERRWMKRVTEI